MTVFEKDAQDRFEEEMRAHLAGYAPKHCESIGELGVRNTIKLGINRSAKHQMKCRGAVRLYIELMIMLGSYFDTDPQLPWGSAALRDLEVSDELARAERLHRDSLTYRETVLGAEYEHETKALLRLVRERFDDWAMLDTPDAMVKRLVTIYPEKATFIGDSALRKLCSAGINRAGTLELDGAGGPAVLVALMFAFGWGVIEDPQFPWVAETLAKHSTESSTQRAEALFRRMIAYAKQRE